MIAAIVVGATRHPGRSRPASEPLHVALVQGNDQNRDLTDAEMAGRLPAEQPLRPRPRDHRPGRPHRVPGVEHEHRSTTPTPAPTPTSSDTSSAVAREHHAWVLANATVAAPPDGDKLLNLDVLFDPSGAVEGTYTKRHLVPFGEPVPFRARARARRRSALSQVPRDFVPGARARALHRRRASASATLICFESAFGYQVRPLVRDGAQVIVLSTNNRSYRRSANSAQHLAIGQMRAAETGRPVVQAAISGITAVIDADGVVHDRTHLFDRDRRADDGRGDQRRDAVRALRRVGDVRGLRDGRGRRSRCARHRSSAQERYLDSRPSSRPRRPRRRPRARDRPDDRRARIDRTAMTEHPRPHRTHARAAALRAARRRPVPEGHRADVRRHVRVARPRRDRPPPRATCSSASPPPGASARSRSRSVRRCPQARASRPSPTRATVRAGCSVVRAGAHRPRAPPRRPTPAPDAGARARCPCDARAANRHRAGRRARRRRRPTHRTRNGDVSTRAVPGCRSPATTRCRRRRSSSASSGCRRRARRRARVRSVAPAAAHDPRQDRTARRIADPVEPARRGRPVRPPRRSSTWRAALRAEMRDQRGGALWATREARPEPHEATPRIAARPRRRVDRRRHDRRHDRRLRHRRDRDAARRHPPRRDRRPVRRTRGARRSGWGSRSPS